jgi:hypothetical protein
VNQKWNTLSTAFAVLLIGTAAAQVPVNNMMASMAANNKQLRQYTYKQRTETYHQGELKNTKAKSTTTPVVSASVLPSTSARPSLMRPDADLAIALSPRR